MYIYIYLFCVPGILLREMATQFHQPLCEFAVIQVVVSMVVALVIGRSDMGGGKIGGRGRLWRCGLALVAATIGIQTPKMSPGH